MKNMKNTEAASPFNSLNFLLVSNVLGKMLSEKANANPSTYHSNPEKLQR